MFTDIRTLKFTDSNPSASVTLLVTYRAADPAVLFGLSVPDPYRELSDEFALALNSPFVEVSVLLFTLLLIVTMSILFKSMTGETSSLVVVNEEVTDKSVVAFSIAGDSK